jgi:hypothetical protein
VLVTHFALLSWTKFLLASLVPHPKFRSSQSTFSSSSTHCLLIIITGHEILRHRVLHLRRFRLHFNSCWCCSSSSVRQYPFFCLFFFPFPPPHPLFLRCRSVHHSSLTSPTCHSRSWDDASDYSLERRSLDEGDASIYAREPDLEFESRSEHHTSSLVRRANIACNPKANALADGIDARYCASNVQCVETKSDKGTVNGVMMVTKPTVSREADRYCKTICKCKA